MKSLVMAIVVGLTVSTVATAAPLGPKVKGVYDANHNVTFSAKKARHHYRYHAHRSGLLATGDIAVVGHRSSMCARITGHLSCGCETASYFGVRNAVYASGRHDLDLASNWRYLPQSPGPCVGCAAYRSGHVMAITGGGPGGWTVKDFNSGRGLTHTYTTASFRGYRFAHPQDLHLADRGGHQRHARRHHQRLVSTTTLSAH